MARPPDYYEVLGVPRDVDAVELKRAYRDLAMRFHPDRNAGDRSAEERFKEVSQAYTVLSDPEKRARYDRLGHLGAGEGAGFEAAVGSFTDLFDSLFGDLFGRKKGKTSGRDLRYTLEVDFAEAALGCEKTITIKARGDCDACSGVGARGGVAGTTPCGPCAGKGEIKVQQGFFSVGKSCPSCRGEGRVVVDRCPTCAGAGTVEKERDFTVKLPPNVEDGNVRRVAGQGEPGRRGGAPGDLHVAVKVRPHPLWKREPGGAGVIVCEVPVSLTQAALGASLEIPTLDGKVDMRIPPGTQSGAVFRLRAKGVAIPGGGRGDAHVRVFVETPVALSEEQREALQRFESRLGEASLPQRRAFLARVAQVAAATAKDGGGRDGGGEPGRP